MAYDKNSPKAVKAREERAAKIQQLTERFNEEVKTFTDTGKWVQFLDFMTSFHAYSVRNQVLIMLQYPAATRVAGFQQWKRKNRQVRKGEKSIMIYAPFTFILRDDDGEPLTDDDGTPARRTAFRPVPVFALEQTDTIDPSKDVLEQIALQGADVNNVYGRVREFMTSRGWTFEEKPLGGLLHGYTLAEDRRITINATDSPAQKAATIIHEAAHAIFATELGNTSHMGEEYTEHRGLAETEAESVAYVVAKLMGLDTSDVSIHYVASWSQQDADTIQAAAENVRKCVNLLADGLNLH